MREGWGGVCAYAAQHEFNDQYDDCDHILGDHMLWYDNDVETLGLEAVQEAVNDVRFAAKVRELGGTVPDPAGRDLDEVRREMTQQILTIGG